jgi:hypothetical protein
MNTNASAPTEKTLGQKIKRYLILTFVVGLIIFTLLTLYATMGSYSDGFRVGNVIKFSNKGFIFKTHEGQLDQGYLTTNAAGMNTRLWDFSAPNDPKIVQDIENAAANQHRVKLFYKEKFFRVFFLGDTKYFIYKVEEVK